MGRMVDTFQLVVAFGYECWSNHWCWNEMWVHHNGEEIYHVFEGTDALVECTSNPASCDRSEACVTQEVWGEMYDACMMVLESTTLEDLVRRTREKQGDPTTS